VAETPSSDEPVTAELRAAPETDPHDGGPGRARLYPKVRGETYPYGVEFFGDVVLGRFDPEVGAVDIDLSEVPDARFVSPRHAKLSLEEGQWWVEDLGSENGVFVNRGPRIEGRVQLKDSDELALGNALFVFKAGDGEEEEVAGG
jgi:hypothetical protein